MGNDIFATQNKITSIVENNDLRYIGGICSSNFYNEVCERSGTAVPSTNSALPPLLTSQCR